MMEYRPEKYKIQTFDKFEVYEEQGKSLIVQLRMMQKLVLFCGTFIRATNSFSSNLTICKNYVILPQT